MLVLAVDTSTPAVTAGVVDVGDVVEVLSEQVHINARGHGEFLAPAIEQALATAHATPRQLSALVSGTGPGPFTGLRVGLVTVAVMAATLGIPGYGVCSLDALAAEHAEEADLLVATDARRKEVYWARYAHGTRIDGPHVGAPAALPDAKRVVGTALYGLAPEASYPSARGLVHLARERVLARAESDPLTPLYLRRPDAAPPSAPKPVSQP